MRTTGICVRPDRLCESVGHPLSYYKARKKEIARAGKKGEAKSPAGGKPPAPAT
jgi:DNA primase large subunit